MARISLCLMMVNSLPSTLKSVPAYLEHSTLSPTFTCMVTSLPSMTPPGPTATTTHVCGFSCADAGRINPLFVFSSTFAASTTTLSNNGLMFILTSLKDGENSPSLAFCLFRLIEAVDDARAREDGRGIGVGRDFCAVLIVHGVDGDDGLHRRSHRIGRLVGAAVAELLQKVDERARVAVLLGVLIEAVELGALLLGGRVGIVRLVGVDGRIGLVGVDGRIGFIGVDGRIGFIGFVRLVGVDGRVGFIGFIGVVGHDDLAVAVGRRRGRGCKERAAREREQERSRQQDGKNRRRKFLHSILLPQARHCR